MMLPEVDWRRRPVLPAAATGRLDRAAIARGMSGLRLMENAGRAVTRCITARFPPQPTLVLCGPGKNGGDGWVVAGRLAAAGWPVRVACSVDPATLRGDAGAARQAWPGPTVELARALEGDEQLVVDALFGVGLQRPIDGAAAAVIEALTARDARFVAVDIPSGVAADTGAILGTAVRADLTVSFCTAKPGHLLLPGRTRTGRLLVTDIGIGQDLIAREPTELRVNGPDLWLAHLPRRAPETHKYSFGHALVVGGPAASTGAARLAATAALRAGAGLSSIACDRTSLPVYAADLVTVMTKPFDSAGDLEAIVRDRRMSAALIGPGAGIGERTLALTTTLIEAGKPLVIDADALTSLAGPLRAGEIRLTGRCVLTPHDGEFARLFDLAGDRLCRARAAARSCGATLILKGADTVVAAPDGRAAIQAQAPPTLATAGTGDVLGGLALGLLAQGVPPYEAAAAAVWLHAEAARLIAREFMAEELAAAVATVRGALLA